MTMGRAKGLTARAAILVGLENTLVPHPKGSLDEERRLLYVAITRATEYVSGPGLRAAADPLRVQEAAMSVGGEIRRNSCKMDLSPPWMVMAISNDTAGDELISCWVLRTGAMSPDRGGGEWLSRQDLSPHPSG